MKKLLLCSVVASALAAPAVVFADDAAPAAAAPAAPASPYTFTGNVSLTTQYIYRGIAQTRGEPAVQGGFDLSHTSGFYLGTWGSSISWISDFNPDVSAPTEWDVYGGYKGTISGDLGFDVGLLTYNYISHGNRVAGFANPDTIEPYAALNWKWLALKYSINTGNLFGAQTPTGGNTDGSGYLDLTGTWDLGSGWGVAAHVGHQEVAHFSNASYTDWRLGVTKDVGWGTVGLTYTDTDAKHSCTNVPADFYCSVNNAGNTYNTGKGALVLSFSKTM
jgi:uncharacterized protein (TIGR02001 family)